MSIKAAVQTVLTILFYVVFLGQTVILAILAGTSGILFGRTRFGWA